MDFTLTARDTLIKVSAVYSLNIFSDNKEEVIKTGFLWWLTSETIETEGWKLVLEYKAARNGAHMQYSWMHTNKTVLQAIFEDLKKQILEADATFIDRAFEEQVLK